MVRQSAMGVEDFFRVPNYFSAPTRDDIEASQKMLHCTQHLDSSKGI